MIALETAPSVRRLVIAGLLTFLAGLVILFPARVAVNLADVPGVSIAGVEGTVWRGSARDVSAGGIYVRDLRWRLKPLSLLLGRLSAAIEASPAGGFVNANASVTAGGKVTVRDLRMSLPLRLLSPLTGIPGLGGTANGDIKQLVIEDGLPTAADGSIEVVNLLLPLVSREPIGGYRAEVFSSDGGIAGSVEDTDGVIDIAGSIELTDTRSYSFVGQVAAKPETPAKLREQMRFLGTPNERGQYELRLEGQL